MIFRLFLEKGIAFFYGATGSQPAFQDSAVYSGSIHSWFDKLTNYEQLRCPSNRGYCLGKQNCEKFHN